MLKKKIALTDGTVLSLEPLNGKENPQEFLGFINSFIHDESYLLVNKPVTLNEEKQWLRTQLQAQRKGEQLYLKALVDGHLVGDCFAKPGFGKNHGNADLGIAIMKEWQGKGIGRVLLTEIIERSEKKWHPHNIYLHVVSENTRARRLYESLGFRIVATLPEWFEYRNRYIDEYLLILDRKRFQTRK